MAEEKAVRPEGERPEREEKRGRGTAALATGPSRALRITTRVLGLCGLVLVGAMLLWGLSLTEAGSQARGWAMVAVAAGAILFLVFLVTNAADIGRFFASRQFLYGTNVAVMVVALAAIVVFLNIFGFKYYAAADWTSEATFTLSTVTQNLVKSLASDVKVIVYFSRGPDFNRLQELLERYRGLSSRVKVEYVDLHDEAAVRPLVEKYALGGEDVVVLDYQGKTKTVNRFEMFTSRGSPYEEMPSRQVFKGEDALTAALRTLVEEEPPMLMFTTGFGEAGVDRGYSEIARLARQANMKVETLSMFGLPTIPDTCDVLVVAGPTRVYDAAAVKAIRDYLQRPHGAAGRYGTAIFLLEPGVDPSGNRIRLTGLEDLLAEFGVTVDRSRVIAPDRRVAIGFMPAPPWVFAATGQDYQPHAITKAIDNAGTLWENVRSLSSGTAQGPYTATPLIRLSDRSWAEVDLADLEDGEIQFDEGADVKGPVTIAMAVSESTPPMAPGAPEPEGLRLVVFGDSTFVQDGPLSSSAANGDLFLNTVRWLTRRTSTMGIEPKEVREVFFRASDGQWLFTLVTMLIVLPVLAILAGVGVWIVRR